MFVATVLTACGIETFIYLQERKKNRSVVATVLTACGIETKYSLLLMSCYSFELQQYLPLAVLKLIIYHHLPS